MEYGRGAVIQITGYKKQGRERLFWEDLCKLLICAFYSSYSIRGAIYGSVK
jgi:hypothetical protein